jgi:RNA polymerase sigma-70 factor, ECF subfamily
MHSILQAAPAFPPAAEDVSALVVAARKDPAAFAALYDRFVRPIYHYLYRHTGNQADAEDLTAQTFLAALEALPRYQERGYLAAWLFAIARSKAMDHFRAGRTQVSFESAVPTSDEADLLGRIVENDELGQLSRLVQTLNGKEQELIRLRYAANLSFPEMAALLGKNEEAVKKSLYRLLARLQSQLEAYYA